MPENPLPGHRTTCRSPHLTRLLGTVALLLFAQATSGADSAADFNDFPLTRPVTLPEWVHAAPVDLGERLEAARRTGKRGLLLYFGRADCAYCQAHLERNWGDPALVRLTRRHFDTVAFDIQGGASVRGLDGRLLPESSVARHLDVVLSPTLVFLDLAGEPVLRLEGYPPADRLRAGLEYVAAGRHRKQSFRSFLRAANGFEAAAFEYAPGEVVYAAPEPLLLDRSRFAAEKPLLVIFERLNCTACEPLYSGPLTEPKIVHLMEQLETVEIDMESPIPVLTPNGEVLPARRWAERLGLSYAPTLMFFDGTGEEILRIDSPVSYYRLNNVLEYVLSDEYRSTDYQSWLFRNAR